MRIQQQVLIVNIHRTLGLFVPGNDISVVRHCKLVKLLRHDIEVVFVMGADAVAFHGAGQLLFDGIDERCASL